MRNNPAAVVNLEPRCGGTCITTLQNTSLKAKPHDNDNQPMLSEMRRLNPVDLP